jgi:NTE family protein
VLNPVPVDVARWLAPGLPVVAVVLSPPLESWDGVEKPRLLTTLPFLANYIGRLRVAQAFNIFLRSVDIAGAMMTELRLQLEKPDVIIRPDVPQIGLLDRVDVHQVAQLGEQAAIQALPALRRAASWQGWLARRIGLPGLRRKAELN